MEISKKQIKSFLEKHYGKNVEIVEFSKIGSGWVANGYELKFRFDNEEKRVAVRMLKDVDFSHDYPSDRGAYLSLQHRSSKMLPNHNKSIGVITIDQSDNVIEVAESNEYFQILEWAKGKEYFNDLGEISTRGSITKNDIDRVETLSNYLVKIHKIKFDGDQDHAKSLYKRHTRDFVGSDFLMDVLDTYPEKNGFVSKDEIYDLVNKIYQYREETKQMFTRLRKVHGDFHPGNVRFYDGGFEVLDSSRVIWGEPADDVACMAINYVWNSIKQRGSFEGDFAKLFSIFYENYVQKSGDNEIAKLIPMFFAVRSIVLTHPIFFDEKDANRKKLFDLSIKLLTEGNFNTQLLTSLTIQSKS